MVSTFPYNSKSYFFTLKKKKNSKYNFPIFMEIHVRLVNNQVLGQREDTL